MLTRLVGLFVPIALWAVFFCIRSTTSVSDATTNRTSGLSVPLFRLPKSVQPVKYHLHIINRIHENVLGYIGNVTISLAVKEPTDEIILHAKLLHDLVITLTDVRNDRIYENVEYSLDNVTELLRIYSSSEPLNLQVDEPYQLEILFNGDIRSHHFGFYRTIYKDDNNQTIPLAATQFEPTSARLAFPCFDEPEFKSTFIISITHGSNYSALSNMPVDGEPTISEDGQMTITRFLETPLMPTYLLAFVVSNYNHITETVNGIEHRVFFPPNSKDNGHRALKNAIKSLQALENLLGIEYPLPKLDHIRIEKTYGSAMENWGLITYNNKNFLTSHDGRDKHSILKMIIVQNHEIAHQWFGNLVSPKWWTYAWLNEGFATYFCYLATELVYPEWKVPEFFVDNEVDIMYSWPINRAMTHYVEKESDIKSAFDVVTYQKAACVIKMFHHAIGHKTFIKGIVHYLNKFQYSVADEEDLFRALQHAVDAEEYNLFQGNQTLTDIMHTWTHNEGLPILTVIRNYNDGTITIQQKSSSKHKNETFWIPLNFVSAANPDFGTTTADYIMPPVHEVTIDLKDFGIDLSNNDWLILNKQQTSLQHINYDDQNLMLIAQTLNTDHKKIHLLNRVVLFRDLATVVDKEHGSIEPVLDVLQYLQFEEDLMPWNTAADLIMELNTFLLGSKVHEKFKAFIRVIVGPIFHKYYKLPKIELEASELYARAKIVELACKVDVVECLDYSKALARDYIFHGVKVDSTLRDIVLCQGIKYETEEDFQKIIGKLISTNSTSELYDDIIYSTRCIEQPENLKYFLQMIFKENTTHHVMTDFESFQYVAFIYVSNFFSRPTLLKFMNRNYERLCKTSMVSVMLDRISNYIADDEREEFISLLDHVASIVKYPANIDNHKIGSRVKKPEHFRQKYEENIEAKLKEFDRIRTARSTASHRRPALLAARYIVAAGFISNLISLV